MRNAGFDTQILTPYLEQGACILTPNNRLTRTLQEAWGQQQLLQQQSVWALPSIYSLNNWLESCWQDLLDLCHPATLTGTVISTHQERTLWQQVIRDNYDLPSRYLAQEAQQAYAIVQNWQIPLTSLSDSPLLISWIEAFETCLCEHNMITMAARNQIITEAFVDKTLEAKDALVLIGFQSHSPAEQSLLKSACSGLINLSLPSRNKDSSCVQFDSIESEFSAAAQWAKTQLEQQPDLRLGIVYGQLAQQRQTVERIFKSHFEPDCWAPQRPESAPKHYNISAGVALTETPLIASAFELLALNKPRLPLADFRSLLYSPFWGSQECLDVRAKADQWLTEQGDPMPSCSDFRYQLNRVEQALSSADEQLLAPLLDQIETLKREAPSVALFSHWASFFAEQLQTLGWPGYRSLSSTEYQQHQHWLQCLNQSAELNEILGEISLNAALSQLYQLATSQVFQAEGQSSNIQILGLLESAAIQFDKLWVIGLDDRQWPNPTRLNALLPAGLQQRLCTPRATPQQELDIAERHLRDLTASAEQIIFSYSRWEGEQELRPSPLLESIPLVSEAQCLSHNPLNLYPLQTGEFATLECIDDSYGPALTETGELTGGGTAIFSDQALCPFNSFARHRLGARNPIEPTLGLSPIEQGLIVHSALEQLWHQLGNQQELLSLGEGQIELLLDKTLEIVLQPWKQRRKRLFGPRFYRLEIKRLKQLLNNWLDLEKQRAPFQVSALESKLETEFAGIPLSLRIDRIDLTSEGQPVLIDYKTGSASINGWLSERIDQPQLPLYALTQTQTIGAVSFGLINSNRCEFKGIGNSQALPNLKIFGEKGIPENEDLLSQWRDGLTLLADEYKAGFASVSFSQAAAINRQAELLPLNRWYQFQEQDQ